MLFGKGRPWNGTAGERRRTFIIVFDTRDRRTIILIIHFTIRRRSAV